MYQTELHYQILSVFIFILGACIGSFINVCIWRIPRSESIVFPPSHCPECDYLIPGYHNIPIISWIVLRGKCANCGQKISSRYIAVEILTGLLITTTWYNLYINSLSPYLIIPLLILISAFIICSAIDIEHLIVPDCVTDFTCACGVISSIIFPQLHSISTTSNNFIEGQNKFILPMVNNLQEAIFHHNYISNIRIQSLLSSILGISFGYLIITGIIEIGKRTIGIKKNHSKHAEGTTFTITEKQICVGEEKDYFEDIFMRKKDTIILFDGTIILNDISREFKKLQIKDEGKTIFIDGEQLKSNIDSLSGSTKHWNIPREVMGFGDAKFMGMLGAFLGPEVCFIVIMLASILGAIAGIGFISLRLKKWYSEIPFVPYLAISAYLWINFSKQLSLFYQKIIFAL
ncbi:MAG: prepilin peptidase [Verrucomicrobiota bacterium]|nr:prepilin peptidase [Verrucomicrobiota bacterium]